MTRIRVQLIALAATVAAISLFAAGCGDDGDGDGDRTDTGPTTALTKAEFLKQGNEICAEGNEEIESGIEEFAEENELSGEDQPSEEQIDALATDILLPSIDRQLEKIRDLGVPSGAEKDVEAFLDNAESAVEEVEADPSLLTAGSSPFTEVNREAIAIGLTVCGQEI